MNLFIIYFVLIFAVLLYLSFHDIRFNEIPTLPTIGGIVITLFFIIINSLFNLNIEKLPSLLDGLIGALIAGGVIFLIVFISKEKAMGKGDILLAIIMGLSLGYRNLFIGFSIAIYSGTIYGLVLSLIKRKFHGLTLPFVPFISLGIVLALLYSSDIINIYYKLTGL